MAEQFGDRFLNKTVTLSDITCNSTYVLNRPVTDQVQKAGVQILWLFEL